jgi:pimeloyl-ACP methyl ester carboxylesterase
LPRVNIANHQLEYAWFGPRPDAAPTLVFLHEGLGCVELWKDFPERVRAATGCGVLVFSRAGYGKSDPVTLPRPVTFMHHEALIVLPQVLDAFAVRQAILIGHSDGGSIALIHAGGVGDPRVKALILLAPHVFVEEPGLESIRQIGKEYRHGNLRQRLERYHGANVDCAFNGWNDVWLNPEFRSWNIEEYLPQINVPILLVQGEDDQYGTAAQVKAIATKSASEVHTVMLKDCGHSPHLEQPEATLAAINEFPPLVRGSSC